jgi:hypothetical protein
MASHIERRKLLATLGARSVAALGAGAAAGLDSSPHWPSVAG